MVLVRVAEVARQRGLQTPAALARAAELSPTTARRWWNGHMRRFTLATLAKLCKALEAQPGDLLEVQL